MAKRKLNINIKGRVQKVRADNPLTALYEAISNSIHSIEDGTSGGAGKIEVTLIRDPKQLELKSDDIHEKPISSIVIVDNGQGFNDKNIDSFCESDSTLKAAKGGKGIGRFSWLKFFEKTIVDSVFQGESTKQRRQFEFSLDDIDEQSLTETKHQISTSLTLADLYPKFQNKTRKSLEDVVVGIVEHFVPFLVTDSLPELLVKDGSASIKVKDFYLKNIGKHSKSVNFQIKNQQFTAKSIRFYLGNAKNTIFLCGNKRASDRIFLDKYNHFFSNRFYDENLKQFSYFQFVESDYLNSIVNDDREGFRFPEANSLEAVPETAITKDEIVFESVRIAQEELKEKIDSMKDTNLDTVKNFIGHQGPQYRHLLKEHGEEIKRIADREPAKIDTALRKIQFEQELRTHAEIAHILKLETATLKVSDKEQIQRRTKELFAKLNDSGKSNLAQYISHRRLILELLKKKLEVEDNAFAKEEAIHELIFPMRKVSDEVRYTDQNLWLIDERLSYHYYLASDKPLSEVDPAESDSRKEPDIIVFNRPIALNDETENSRHESIVIVEFKRPGHTAVKGEKNPVDQILDYIDEIQAGRAKNRNGRAIEVSESTYYFGYVVCEVDELLRKTLSKKNMKKTPDGRGMFGYFEAYRAYVEVINYDKMIDDAMKRNRILFETLQMPTIT